MILVDTSVWAEHLRYGHEGLTDLLDKGAVLVHPFVVGELACGNLRNRSEVLGLLQKLPAAPVASDEEVLLFIERRDLMGRGIGLVDVHLLAAVSLLSMPALWSLDRPLRAAATELGLAAPL